MAVDGVRSKLQPSIALVIDSNIATTTTEVAKGFYSVSYVPATAFVSILSSGSNQTISGGNGLFVHKESGPITFQSNFIGVQIILYSTDVEVVSLTSNTVESIYSSGTYTNTGNARVCVIGGGNSGTATYVKAGGVGGGARGGTIALPGSVPVTIGAGGAAPPPDGWYGSNGGGSTTFGSITAPGGAGGGPGSGAVPAGPFVPGVPGEATLAPTGFLNYLSGSISGGASALGGGPGGNICAGGGWGNNGGGGGGGGVPGQQAPGGGQGGAGGAGAVFLIRY